MTAQPRCPHCRGTQVFWDALEAQYACLACGWRHYAPPLPYVNPGRRLDRAGRARPK